LAPDFFRARFSPRKFDKVRTHISRVACNPTTLSLASGTLALLLQQNSTADVRRAEVSLLQCKYVSMRGAVQPVLRFSEELRQLCELASKEMDPEKLLTLVKEIDRLFQEYEQKKTTSRDCKD
jgi:hypothetical protein